MKLATFVGSHGQRIAAVIEDAASGTWLVDLRAAYEQQFGGSYAAFSTMIDLIDAGDAGLDCARSLLVNVDFESKHVFPLSTVRLEAPLPRPVQLRDFSVFEEHLRDAGVGLARLEARSKGTPEPDPHSGSIAQVYKDYPLFYYSNRMNVSGTGIHLDWPQDVKLLDFELEIAAVIGKPGKDIPVDEAGEHIFGYTIFNDVSARDIQWRQMKGFLGPCKAKSMDGCNVLGPWIVTRDELQELSGLRATVCVNGTAWIETEIRGMVHSFEQMLSFASQHETIHAGEVFGSGTIGGCCGLEMDRWIEKGALVEFEVEKMGKLVTQY